MSEIKLPNEYSYLDNADCECDGGLPDWAYAIIGVAAGAALFAGGYFTGRAIARRAGAGANGIPANNRVSVAVGSDEIVLDPQTLQENAARINPAMYGGVQPGEVHSITQHELEIMRIIQGH